MKVLVLNGSPKKISDTMKITSSFLNGLNYDNSCEIKILDVINLNIKPCMGCFACWKMQNGRCVQKDDMNQILEDIISSDVIIWSFPLYCYGMPSHLKAVLDRTIPFAKMSMREENGRVVHNALVDLSSKKYIVISGCGFPNFEENFEPLRKQCINCFGNSSTIMCIPEAPMMNVDSAKPLTDLLLSKVEKAGVEFNKNGCVSVDTLKEVQVPMIPNEIYINIVNSQ